MDSTVTDRHVGSLHINSPLPNHLSPAAKSPKLFRNNSETAVPSSSTNPSVPRSSSFTGSKRFLTGKGLSARESLGIIDQPDRCYTASTNVHCDYQAARNIIMDTLSSSPKETPPPPKPNPSPVPFVSKRPPTPPPMPHFTTPAKFVPPKRVRIDPKPPIELPAASPIHTPPASLPTPQPSVPSNSSRYNRSPFTPLSAKHNTVSISPTPPSNQPKKQPRASLFGLLSARVARKDGLPATLTHAHASPSQSKQNAAPLNIADIANAPKVECLPRKTDENSKPVFDTVDTSSDDSYTHRVPNICKRMLVVDQMPPDTKQRPHAPLARQKHMLKVPKDNESTETTESEKYKDCESPVLETNRRVEIFRRFRFVQEGRQRPEQLSDFVQTDIPEKVDHHQVPDIYKIPFEPIDPLSHHEDKLSFTSAHEDGERSSDEHAPCAMRDIRRDPRMRMRLPKLPEPEPTLLDEEKGRLPHVESITTSSSSHSKDTSDSPSTERKMGNAMQDTSVPFTQAEMPHLRLGRGNVTAHAFMQGPSPSKMGKVAHLRRDSRAAFLDTGRQAKLEQIKYGGHEGQRETTPLGSTAADASVSEGGEIKRTMSGLQRKLKEAGAELVSKAKKIPRGTSFSILRSNSLKDLRSATYGKGSETDGETEGEATRKRNAKKTKMDKGIERSKSLPRDSMRELPRVGRVNDESEKEGTKAEARQTEEKAEAETTGEMPEFVTIKRIIRRVRRDGSEEMITKKVRVRPERILPNGDVVIKRTMKRNKDDGDGTETLTVLQVIPRRKNIKKGETVGNSEAETNEKKDTESFPELGAREKEKDLYDEGFVRRSGSFKRRSSGRSKTDMVDEGGRWRRARSFGRVRGDAESKNKRDERGGVGEGAKGLLPRCKSGSRGLDRETRGLGENEEGKTRLKKKSLPRVMSFHGRGTRRKESGASNKSEGSWWRFRTLKKG